MNRLVFACLMMAAMGIALPAWAQGGSQYSMDYWAYTHQEGDWLDGLGFVDDIQPPLTVDLQNCTVSDEHGLKFEFEVDDFRRRCLLEGLDDIALTLARVDEISAYESAHGYA